MTGPALSAHDTPDWSGGIQHVVTPSPLQYALAALMTAVATVIAVGLDRNMAIPNLSLIYVIPVVIAAAIFSLVPSLFAAVLGALAYNYFFTEPRYTFSVDDPSNVWAIGFLFVVGCIVSAVASTARRRAGNSAEMKRKQVALQAFSNKILTASNLDDAEKLTQSVIQNLFGVQAVIIRPAADNLAIISGTAALSVSEQKAALHSADTGEVLIGGQYPFDASRFDFYPVGHVSGSKAVIGFSFGDGERPEDLRLYMDTVVALFSCTIDRFVISRHNVGRDSLERP